MKGKMSLLRGIKNTSGFNLKWDHLISALSNKYSLQVKKWKIRAKRIYLK